MEESKAKLKEEYGISLTPKKIVNPLTAAKQNPQTCGELLQLVKENPDAFLRKSSFDGLGEWVKSEDLEECTAFLFDCEILDYNAVDPKTKEEKHYRYSVWLGVRESDDLSFIYAAGSKLTQLAELLLNGDNDKTLAAVREKGAHVKFPKMRRLSNGNNFMDVQLIP